MIDSGASGQIEKQIVWMLPMSASTTEVRDAPLLTFNFDDRLRTKLTGAGRLKGDVALCEIPPPNRPSNCARVGDLYGKNFDMGSARQQPHAGHKLGTRYAWSVRLPHVRDWLDGETTGKKQLLVVPFLMPI